MIDYAIYKGRLEEAYARLQATTEVHSLLTKNLKIASILLLRKTYTVMN